MSCGGFHGAVEAISKSAGPRSLPTMWVICRAELNAYNSEQCGHGIGHGLMAATNYELPVALEQCNELTDEMHDSCWSGVFMENILGYRDGHIPHTTKYVNDDPQYPCTIVADIYKKECYLYNRPV